MSEVRYRSRTVLACNVREGDVVVRVGKKVKSVTPRNGEEVSIKVERVRKHIVLEKDRLVRVRRPSPVPPPTEKKKRAVRWARYLDERQQRAMRELGEILARRYPKKELMSV